MRTVRYLLAALAAVLALTGCGGQGEAAGKPTPSLSPEDAYIAQLEESVPTYVVKPGRDRFIDLGYQACQSLESGSQPDDQIVAGWAITQGIEREQAAAGLQAARDHLCPDL